MPSFSLPLLEYAPWSPSKMGQASKCALAFKYKYIDKIRSDFKSSAAQIGTTVHRVQELLFLGKEVEEAFEQSFLETKNLTSVEKEKVKTFAGALMAFYNRVKQFQEKHTVTELFTECKWAMTEEFTSCDFFADTGIIRGVIDMGMLVNNDRLIVIDHKSGRVKPVSEFGTQLDIYTLMAHAHYPEVKSVQCAINFLAVERVVWNPPRTKETIITVLRPWLLSSLNTCAKNVEGFSPHIGRHCNWCEYADICPEQNTEKPCL